MSTQREEPQEDPAPASADPTASSPASEPLPDAVSAYRKILGETAPSEELRAQTDSETFSYWSYPSFDASLPDDQEKKPLDAPNDLAAFAREAAGAAAKAKKRKKKKKKSEKLKLQIVHQTAGRVRMKVAGAKGDPDALKDIAETFRLIPGVEQIAVNSVTGSIILHYDEDNQKAFNDRFKRSMMSHGGSAMLGSEFDELARKIENEAEFLAQRSEAARAIVDFFKQLDRDIKIATHNVLDLKIVLAVGVIALTIFEIGAHAATPVWLTLSIFTFNHFLELRTPAEEEEEALAFAPVVFKTPA
jgi:hypothetical protein